MQNKKLSKTSSSINSNSHAAEQNPKLAYRPFGSQVQKASVAPVTETDIEDITFAEQSIEATGLELQAKYGKITPEGQERLTVLQAKMDGLLNSRLEHATRFGHNFANIPLRRPHIAAPIQAKLTIGEPGDKYEQEADETARQVVQSIHQPQSDKLQRESLPEEEEELQMKPMVQQNGGALQGMIQTVKNEQKRGDKHRRGARAQKTIALLSNNIKANLDGHIFNALPVSGGLPNPASPVGLHAYTNGGLPNGIQQVSIQGSATKVHNLMWRWSNGTATKSSTMFPNWMPPSHVRTLIALDFPDTRQQDVAANLLFPTDTKVRINRGHQINLHKAGDTVYPTL